MTDARRLEKAKGIIAALVEWDQWMGGWDAPCWTRAKRFLKDNAPRCKGCRRSVPLCLCQPVEE